MAVLKQLKWRPQVKSVAFGSGPVRHEFLPYLLTAPVLICGGIVLLMPLGVQLYYSFMARERGTLAYYIGTRATLDNYVQIITRSDLVGSMLWSFGVGFVVAIGIIALGLPVAHFLARGKGIGKTLVEMSLLLPLFGDIYLAFALMYAFAPQGIVNWALRGLGLIHDPILLMSTPIAAIIAMLLPSTSVLLVESALVGIEPVYEEAALTLGASPLRAWLSTTLALARTGLVGAFLLTFSGAIGAFTIPAVLAGTSNPWISTQIANISQDRNIPLGSALAIVLMTVSLATIYAYLRLTEQRFEVHRNGS
ncbi:MAG TPA: ABC transporter permease [Chloroflexota bacterium]|nr:ABC transporter permease [Chloroflexota bacterium]